MQRCKPATINRRLATLRKFFRWAKQQGHLAELPTETIKSVQSQATTPKWLEKREADRLIRAGEKDGNKRNVAILQLLRNTGLRVGELCALRLDDVEISERKGRLVVRSGKGSKHREIPLNLDARQALTLYLNVRPAVEDNHAFVGQRGEGIKPQAVENMVRKCARLAALENVTPHVFRHTFGKSTLDAGENQVTVATLIGHARLDTTAIYTQPSDRDLERAVERLETR